MSQEVYELHWSINIQGYTLAVMTLEPNNATLLYSCTVMLKMEEHMESDKCAVLFIGDNNDIVLASNPVT